ncbi:homoserine dehydrogenase [Hydrogenivirga sp. 128-5-R1-1]|uniref:homoserine dehydrogenase n=1 Tax=Hydrogenivirga sp. 128-5-R1-1 TaxID=392423 RepID=UPI00015F1927|nr:homoserine dehydrogenase [Hydrogenivirga sp. 128-5-R1-1]EDP75449.1 homoserine dehydrogenase [Hydrogenivirga sp. 128-5-R1-1]
MKVSVGIVGCGVVGTGTARLLLGNREVLRKKTGIDFELRKVADLDWSRKREFNVPEEVRTTDYKEVLESCDIVVELVGGKDFAKRLILEALDRGKHVVTANKHLLALEGEEIFLKAQEKNLRVGFEASVGGGIPVIKALREGLVGNRIGTIYGILNGTTNYILTRMFEENLDFDSALREASDKGYAEADPSLDIDGWDAAHKINILASLAFGRYFPFEEVHVEGIRDVDKLDVELGKELGYTLKLLAIAKRFGGEAEIRVHPTFIHSDEALAKVSGVYNAVMIEGDFVGKTMFYGQGAGSLPTASAVVSDIVDVGRSLLSGNGGEVTPIDWEDTDIKVRKNFFSRYYLRFDVPDRPGVLASISRVLADFNISIAAVLQKEMVCELAGRKGEPVVPLVVLTHKAYELDVQKALSEIEGLPVVVGKPVLIRVEEEAE